MTTGCSEFWVAKRIYPVIR